MSHDPRTICELCVCTDVRKMSVGSKTSPPNFDFAGAVSSSYPFLCCSRPSMCKRKKLRSEFLKIF